MGPEAAAQESRRAWDGVLRREVAVSLRVIDEESRSIEVIASTETLDSHGDVLKQFWDLSRYQKNGPVLWNHNIHESGPFSFGGAVRPEDTMPIGKGDDARVESGKLIARLTLVKGSREEEPFVDKLWRRIQQGVIKAVSVGFRPGTVTRVLNAAGATDHFELGSAERPNELREISFVPMGSNPDAVAKSIAWERKHLEDDHQKTTAASAAQEGTTTMAMTPEEQKALDDARTAKTAAETRLADIDAKHKTLESSLTAEKAISTKLEADLKAKTEELTKSNAARATTEMNARQSVKFAPNEREELDKLVAEVGLDRTLKLIDARPDLTVTTPVKVDGKGLPASLPAPAPVDGEPADASGDLVKSVNARVNGATPTAAA